ncbi:hypothetical protein [Dyella sp.]|jgi:hypothetical protein|uniref:hypothetical protein n=1 Tax=Dyella sp. TaxID=1869338 RepID=UPI002D76A2BC|nr:hypothetical protein [Dyella sp.]HET6431779.1 hypothetical protein [Dyella sp.]
MKTSARPLLLCSLAASGLLMLSACGKHDDAVTTAPAGASTAATPTTNTPATPMAPVTPAPASTAPAAAGTAALPAPATTSMAPARAGTSASAATAAPADTAFAIDKVVVGDAVTAAHTVSKPKDTIPASQNAIYASVQTRGVTDGATLSARWSYVEGKDQLVSAISQSIATRGPAVTTFKIQNPHNWPEGKYKVEIALDGKPVSTQAFEVKASS